MLSKPALVLFAGGFGGTPIERLVDEARLACAMDALDAARESGQFGQFILATDGAVETEDFPGLRVDVQPGDFHFGRRLAGIIRRFSLESVVYLGAGVVPLFTAADYAAIASEIRSRALTNNPYSSDIVAFLPDGALLGALESLDTDNGMARLLKDLGHRLDVLPRTVATQLDIDGPTDLAVLKLSSRGGSRLRARLRTAQIETAPYERVASMLTDRTKQIVVAGRVGSHAWPYLESESACRVRLFAEERGMQADGRAAAGSARSLLAFFLECAGMDAFFDALADLGDAAFIDTRVILAHLGLRPSRSDRFLSDARQPEQIEEPWLRRFTAAAMAARTTVLLGGHSLVSGDLMLLNEMAWQELERSPSN